MSIELPSRPLAVLGEAFQPNAIPHRTEQAKIIADQIRAFFDTGNPADNLLILGRTGTGKTETLRHALSRFPPSYFKFIRGDLIKTPVGVLEAIRGKKGRNESQLLDEIIQELRNLPKAIVIDEVAKIGRLPELFTNLNVIYRDTEVPIIVVTNVSRVVQEIPEDAAATLGFKIVNFWEYTKEQLLDILNDRVALLPRPYRDKLRASDPHGGLTGTVEYICSKAAKEGSGNARRARSVLQKCFVENRFGFVDIDEFFDRAIETNWAVTYGNLSRAERAFLHDLIELTIRKEGARLNLLQIERATGLSKPRVSSLLSILEEQRLITTTTKSHGYRAGKSRFVQFLDNETFQRLAELDEYATPDSVNAAVRTNVEGSGQALLEF